MPTYSNPASTSRAARRPSAGAKSTLPTPTSGAGIPMPVASPDGKNQRHARKMLMDNTQLAILQMIFALSVFM